MVAEVEGQVEEEQLDPEREARRRIALAQVRQYPDAALRMRAREVEVPGEAITRLAERMAALMKGASGVGLAAPQVGILQRVLVYEGDDDEVVALVNPRVIRSSDERETAEEGCLSLGMASVTVEVERPSAVTVEAMSPAGEGLHIEAEGLTSRVIQHEIDHLDGILIIDRTTPEQRRSALAQLRPQPVLGPIG